MANLCAAVLSELGRPGFSLAVVFVGTRRMRLINRRYRGKDYATDVLSFNYGQEDTEGERYLGDIIISLETAFAQIPSRKKSRERELRKLLVHGILHLLGYDHETDHGEMNRLQERLLRRRALSSSSLR